MRGAKVAVTQEALIDDLEDVIADRGISERAAVLRRVTDMFLLVSGRLSEEQIALFDDVMVRLLAEIEISARAAFGHLLAAVADAPPNVMRALALDDSIDVAGQVLGYSDRLSESTLVEGAKTKSQAHLLAVAGRKTLTEPVTDVLVDRGNRQVALQTAENSGAAFSEFGYSTLVQRAVNDKDLAISVWTRPEIPRQHLLKLFAEASESVKASLAAEGYHRTNTILEVIAQASENIRSQAREKSPGFTAARNRVQALYTAGKLGEGELAAFARGGKFDETCIALSLISNLPIAVVERAFVDQRPEQLIVVGRAVGLAWETVKAMLALCVDFGISTTSELELSFETFMRLKVETAKKAIRFYRLREKAGKPRRP
jgi:uncharacterized protein (DUF2336 family)